MSTFILTFIQIKIGLGIYRNEHFWIDLHFPMENILQNTNIQHRRMIWFAYNLHISTVKAKAKHKNWIPNTNRKKHTHTQKTRKKKIKFHSDEMCVIFESKASKGNNSMSIVIWWCISTVFNLIPYDTNSIDIVWYRFVIFFSKVGIFSIQTSSFWPYFFIFNQSLTKIYLYIIYRYTKYNFFS